jgi:hypothetical protein
MAKVENSIIADDQIEGGVNVNAKEMLLENGKAGTKIKYNDRMEVVLLKDTTYQKKGKVYSPSKVKALWLINKGIAKEVK